MASTHREGDEVITPSACCVCFPSTTANGARNSIQLSEVYCPTCSDVPIDSPSCLTTITKHKPPEQIKTLLNVESEIEYSKNFNKKLILKKSPAKSKCKKKEKKEKVTEKVNQDEYEIACEAADDTEEESGVDDGPAKIGIMTETDKKNMIRVNGKEETPCVPTTQVNTKPSKKSSKKKSLNLFLIKQRDYVPPEKVRGRKSSEHNSINNNAQISLVNEGISEESDGNNNNDDNKPDDIVKYSTLPMVNKQKHKRTIAIPQRTTSDGTKIFYLCDLPKKLQKGFSFIFFN